MLLASDVKAAPPLLLATIMAASIFRAATIAIGDRYGRCRATTAAAAIAAAAAAAAELVYL